MKYQNLRLNSIFTIFSPSITNNQIAFVSNMSKFNKIANKLGIPGPPKKPSTGYFRFSQEVRKAPGKSLIENTALVASQWKKLSDEQKEKYNREFKKEYVRHFFSCIIIFSQLYFNRIFRLNIANNILSMLVS